MTTGTTVTVIALRPSPSAQVMIPCVMVVVGSSTGYGTMGTSVNAEDSAAYAEWMEQHGILQRHCQLKG